MRTFSGRLHGRCFRAAGSLDPGRHVRARADDDGSGKRPNLNPIDLGRQTRRVIDEAWLRVTKGSRASFTLEDDLGAGRPSDLEAPQAMFTNVLVVGGTGRLGRIIVRKLLLRGYTVRVMCRDSSGDAADILPGGVEICRGDVANLDDCHRAVEDMDKIIYCATSRVQMTGEYNKVENLGVSYMARSWLDLKQKKAMRASTIATAVKRSVVDFETDQVQDEWDMLAVGPTDTSELSFQGQDRANCLISEDGLRLVFAGTIYSRSGVAEWGGPLQASLADSEGLRICALADGKPYACVVVDQEGWTYVAKFTTKLGFNAIRLTWNMFRGELTPDGAPPALRPEELSMIKFRFEKAAQPELENTGKRELNPMSVEYATQQRDRNLFEFELHYIKALPVPPEPSFILVSQCGNVDLQLGRQLSLKRRGEAALRNSGVGYTIVRPLQLEEEPGGYRALVFDQGNRIEKGIGYADTADVCMKALHMEEAVNKTFEVAYEITATDSDDTVSRFELVAHMPGRSSNYLVPALSTLERNT